MRATLALLVAGLANGACAESHDSDGGAAMDAGADAGAPDAGAPDAGAPDAGAADAGAPDAEAPDAGTDAGPPPAGLPCEVASVPAGGFDTREIYIEVSATCGESCMVYQLAGDPTPGCSGGDCADPMEVADRVFCTCRCGGPDPSADYCTCPTAMTCVADVVRTGSSAGDYCVNDRAL